jgi:hypothetical protein
VDSHTTILFIPTRSNGIMEWWDNGKELLKQIQFFKLILMGF